MRRIIILSAFLLLASFASALDAAKEADENNEQDYISLAGDTKVNDYWQDEETFDNYSDEWESYEEGDNKEHQADPNGHSEEGEDEEEDSEEDPPKPEDHASILPVVSTTLAPTASANVSAVVQELKELLSTAAPRNESKTAEFMDPDYYQPDPEESFYDEQSPILEVEIEISREPVGQKESEVSINWPAETPAGNQNIEPENPEAKEEDVDKFTKVVNEWRNWEYSERLQKIRRFQGLFTGLLVGFFALTVAVVLFTFYRGFIVCARTVRRSGTGDGYKRMEEDVDSPIFQQHP